MRYLVLPTKAPPTTRRAAKATKKRLKTAEMVNNRSSRHMYCKKAPLMDIKMVSSKELENGLVQDRSRPMIIFGSDDISQYPNLRSKEYGEEVYQAVMDSDIKWEGVHWKEAVRYVAMTRGYHWCKQSKLRRVLPDWKFAHGS